MGQAQSGAEGQVVADGPSRHVKVPADLLIPPNIVIDDTEMLQAVQRRISRGILAPFFPPSEDDKDEECPICCDHFRDLNWFTCCNHPICSECFVRLWQERLEALDTDITCPFCKHPNGDAHLRFIKLSEKAKKARRKAEEESVHAQKIAQQREREREPLSSLNNTAQEQLMWAPASHVAAAVAAHSHAPRQSLEGPSSPTPPTPPTQHPVASEPPASVGAAPSRGRSRTPPVHPPQPPSSTRSAGAGAHRSRSRTPSAAPATAKELALEVESAVLERSYHGGSRGCSRRGSRVTSREPSVHSRAAGVGGRGEDRSCHAVSQAASPQQPDVVVAMGPSPSPGPGLGPGPSQLRPLEEVTMHASQEPYMHAPEPEHTAAQSNSDDTSTHAFATPSRAEPSEQAVGEKHSHTASHPSAGIPPAVAGSAENNDQDMIVYSGVRSGCLGFGLSRGASRDMSTHSGYEGSNRSRSFWNRSRRGSSNRGGEISAASSRRGSRAGTPINATAREHSHWAPPKGGSGNLSGALSTPDSHAARAAERSSPLVHDAARVSGSLADLSPAAASAAQRSPHGATPLSPHHPQHAQRAQRADSRAQLGLARESSVRGGSGEGSRRGGKMASTIHRSIKRAFSGALTGRSRHGGSREQSNELSMRAGEERSTTERHAASQRGQHDQSQGLSRDPSALQLSREPSAFSASERSNYAPVGLNGNDRELQRPPSPPPTGARHTPRDAHGRGASPVAPKAGVVAPALNRSQRAARAAQAKLNKAAAPAGAVRPGHHPSLQHQMRSYARGVQLSQTRNSQGSMDSSSTLSAAHAVHGLGDTSPSLSAATSRHFSSLGQYERSLNAPEPPSGQHGPLRYARKERSRHGDAGPSPGGARGGSPVAPLPVRSNSVSRHGAQESAMHGVRSQASSRSGRLQKNVDLKDPSLQGGAGAIRKISGRSPCVASPVHNPPTPPHMRGADAGLDHNHPVSHAQPGTPSAAYPPRSAENGSEDEPLLPIIKDSELKKVLSKNILKSGVGSNRPGVRTTNRGVSPPTRKTRAEIAASAVALKTAFLMQPPDPCSAAPMKGESAAARSCDPDSAGPECSGPVPQAAEAGLAAQAAEPLTTALQSRKGAQVVEAAAVVAQAAEVSAAAPESRKDEKPADVGVAAAQAAEESAAASEPKKDTLRREPAAASKSERPQSSKKHVAASGKSGKKGRPHESSFHEELSSRLRDLAEAQSATSFEAPEATAVVECLSEPLSEAPEATHGVEPVAAKTTVTVKSVSSSVVLFPEGEMAAVLAAIPKGVQLSGVPEEACEGAAPAVHLLHHQDHLHQEGSFSRDGSSTTASVYEKSGHAARRAEVSTGAPKPQEQDASAAAAAQEDACSGDMSPVSRVVSHVVRPSAFEDSFHDPEGQAEVGEHGEVDVVGEVGVDGHAGAAEMPATAPQQAGQMVPHPTRQPRRDCTPALDHALRAIGDPTGLQHAVCDDAAHGNDLEGGGSKLQNAARDARSRGPLHAGVLATLEQSIGETASGSRESAVASSAQVPHSHNTAASTVSTIKASMKKLWGTAAAATAAVASGAPPKRGDLVATNQYTRGCSVGKASGSESSSLQEDAGTAEQHFDEKLPFNKTTQQQSSAAYEGDEVEGQEVEMRHRCGEEPMHVQTRPTGGQGGQGGQGNPLSKRVDTSRSLEAVSKTLSGSLPKEEGAAAGRRLYMDAADMATGVAAAAEPSESVVIADESFFCTDGREGVWAGRTQSCSTLYTRITEAATGVEAEVTTGVESSPQFCSVTSAPDFLKDLEQIRSPDLARPCVSRQPGLSNAGFSPTLPYGFESSMHGSSLSGGDIHHASRYAEAAHMATRVAVGAGGLSPDVSVHGPSMHASFAPLDVLGSSKQGAVTSGVATGVATGATTHRGIGADISSTGASSISFGDDASMHRVGETAARTYAHGAAGAHAWAADSSNHSSISFGTSWHHEGYACATRGALGVSAAAVAGSGAPPAGEGSSAGASSISFGDDASTHRGRPQDYLTARTARDILSKRFPQRALPPGHSKSLHAGLVRSASWRRRAKRTGSMHAGSAHAGLTHERSRKIRPAAASVSATSYAQEVAAGVIASVSASGRDRQEASPSLAQVGGIVSSPTDTRSRAASSQWEHHMQRDLKLRESHRSVAPQAASLTAPQHSDPMHGSEGLRNSVYVTQALRNTANEDVRKASCTDKVDACEEDGRLHDAPCSLAYPEQVHKYQAGEMEDTASKLVFCPPPPTPQEEVQDPAQPAASGESGMPRSQPLARSETYAEAGEEQSQRSPSRLSAEDLWRADLCCIDPSSRSVRTSEERADRGEDVATGGVSSSAVGAPVAICNRARQQVLQQGGVSSSEDSTGAHTMFHSLSPGSTLEEGRMLQAALALSRADAYCSHVSDVGATQVMTPFSVEGEQSRVATRCSADSLPNPNGENTAAAVPEHSAGKLLSGGSGEVGVRQATRLSHAVAEDSIFLNHRQTSRGGPGGRDSLDDTSSRRSTDSKGSRHSRHSRHSSGSKHSRHKGSPQQPNSSRQPERRRSSLDSSAHAQQMQAQVGGKQAVLQQQRSALEAILSPGVLSKIIEEAGEMDDEELADFLHAFELSCMEEARSDAGSSGGRRPVADSSPHAVCETFDGDNFGLCGSHDSGSCMTLKESCPAVILKPEMATDTDVGSSPQCKVVSCADEGSGSFYESAQEASRSTSCAVSSSEDMGCREESVLLQEASRSVSRSDTGDQSVHDATTRLEDFERMSPRSKLVRQCERTLDDLMHGGSSQNIGNDRKPLRQHSSSTSRSSGSHASHRTRNVSTRMHGKHESRPSLASARYVCGVTGQKASLHAPAAAAWIEVETGRTPQSLGAASGRRVGADRNRRLRGAVCEGLSASHESSSSPASHDLLRSPSFDFCCNVPKETTCSHFSPTCVRSQTIKCHAADTPADDSDVYDNDMTQISAMNACDPCTEHLANTTGYGVHDLTTLSVQKIPGAWASCMQSCSRAVCEAYSSNDGEAGEADGAEIFREEGEGGPEGPEVPEGAVAGVVVVQPDGSPCIGWLVAHPAIAHLSDTMRQALVTLSVVHARDLQLQSRIACDDDRLLHAIALRDRAAASPSAPLGVARSGGGGGGSSRTGARAAAMDHLSSGDSPARTHRDHSSPGEPATPASSCSQSPPINCCPPPTIDDSCLVAAVTKGDLLNKPVGGGCTGPPDDSVQQDNAVCADVAPEGQKVGERSSGGADGGEGTGCKSGKSGEDRLAKPAVGGEDWLERMRRRDAELQARIARHDIDVFGASDR